jgi:hypothetical protein
VRRNVERFGATGKLDVAGLLQLPDDAVPAIFDSLPRLPPEDAARVLDVECNAARRSTGGLWAFNAVRSAANHPRNRHTPPAPVGR